MKNKIKNSLHQVRPKTIQAVTNQGRENPVLSFTIAQP